MRIRGTLVVLVSCFGLGLFGCGGANANGDGAKGPDPWADFKGTYASPGEPRGTSSMSKGDTKSRDAKAKAEAKAAAVEEAPAKKSSKGTIHGESISAIGADALADAAKGALKSKVVSSNVVVGAQYEQVHVQLKGASVQIIRPATSPDPNGSAVSAPKSRSAELSKAESGWYDEEADVLVIVDAGKKSAAQRVLGTLLKR